MVNLTMFHKVISFPPDVQVSTLVGNLKTVSSRLIRKEFADWIFKFYKKPVFWSGDKRESLVVAV